MPKAAESDDRVAVAEAPKSDNRIAPRVIELDDKLPSAPITSLSPTLSPFFILKCLSFATVHVSPLACLTMKIFFEIFVKYIKFQLLCQGLFFCLVKYNDKLCETSKF